MQHAPLRSGTDRSDPGFIRAAAERAAIEKHAGAGAAVHSLPGCAGLLVRARYPAFDGPIAAGPHLRIGLCLGPSASMMQEVAGTRLEGVWRPGTFAITPPYCAGHAASGAVSMIGLAILPDARTMAPPLDADRLHRLATGFHRDELLSAVLMALHHEADAHGSSTAFFEHGMALILRRLAELPGAPAATRPVRPLSETRHRRLATYVDARLGDDLAVVDMAAALGMEPSGFTRALRARTGLAPYAWLTARRMDHAARLLAGGRPVTWVAAQVGYANAGKFAAAFRRFHGVPPSRWRAEE